LINAIDLDWADTTYRQTDHDEESLLVCALCDAAYRIDLTVRSEPTNSLLDELQTHTYRWLS